ncbi:MAG TPA: hypothetical protein VFL04_05255, partial [Rectinemataceae bacterium]|nr:hypothetical protein [Rectinemataceae bacterium]
WTSAQGRVAATTGDLDALRALLARTTADSALSEDPVFAAFAKGLPGKVVSVGSFSTRRLASMVAGLAASAQAKAGPKIDPSRFSAWYGYLSTGAGDGAAGSWLEGGVFIPSGDAAALIDLAGPILGRQGQ